MSPSSPAWTVVAALLSVAALVLLVRRARQGDTASRWLAVAAALWGGAFAAQGASVGQVTPAAIQLTLTDLLALLGIPALVLGLLRLAQAAGGDRRAGVTGRIADGCLLGLAVLAVGWIAVLRPAYAVTDVGAGSFTVDVVHPAVDIVVLACTLGLAIRAGRRGVAPYLALCAATFGDLVAVQARASGTHPGTWPQLAWLAAIALLGASAWLPRPGGDAQHDDAQHDDAQHDDAQHSVALVAEPPVTTLIALGAAGIASLVTLVYAAVVWGRSGPLALLICAILMLALIARIVGLVRQAASMSVLAEQSDSQFHQLAERTSDVVLVCDATGLISYVSKAVFEYGYPPASLTGTRLLDLVHPDDLPDVIRAATAVWSATGSAPTENTACRVRSSDGTWRHVQATISGYSGGLLLVTVRDVSDQVELRRQVTHLTFHDGLTGLPNRSYLEERAKDLLARDRHRDGADGPERIGAIFVDLDGFTAINDSVGHGAGDLVLAEAGRRLRSVVPAHDTVARWGGDEFAVLVDGAATPQEIVEIAERLASAIAGEPFGVAGRDIAITASLGVAFADPEVAEHLLRNADLAMSRAKDGGGGRVEVFAAHMHADVIRRLELAADLRAAIDDGSIGIEYQPVVELTTSRVASVEALVRWTRAGERLDPAEFLGVAEDSGLIVPLGILVLREACRQVASWREAGWLVGLSVNFSLRQVSSPGFAEDVLTALDDSGLPRSALTLEVTERVLIEIGGQVMEGLAWLRHLGVRLAIDDFGTGYASLAYLRELPVDIIKIDPSFVAGLGADGTLAMLTRTIVQVGHDLGIEIVAEGIERPEQLELLRAMGCGLGQGYLVARPMAAPRIDSLVESGTRRLEPALLADSEPEEQAGPAGETLPFAENAPFGEPGPAAATAPGQETGPAGETEPAAEAEPAVEGAAPETTAATPAC